MPTPTSEAAPKLIELGIHLGLDEDRYHADPALGSSDLRKLRRNPTSYWYESAYNPNRPADKDTPARVRGRALHKLVLEGEAAFDKLYCCGARHEEDMTPSEKAAATKATNASAAAKGLVALPAADYDRIIIASAMITMNPELKSAFTGGLPEVSVFWERDGVRRKARYDFLKPRGIGDLKGCANTKNLAFPHACINDITNYAYHVQAAHYLEGRSLVPQMIADKMVHGADDADLLKKVAEAKQFAWQWIFYQMEGAPITWSSILSPQNPILEIARRQIEEATDNYKAYMDKFGTDQMWLLIEKPQELAIEDLPSWFGR